MSAAVGSWNNLINRHCRRCHQNRWCMQNGGIRRDNMVCRPCAIVSPCMWVAVTCHGAYRGHAELTIERIGREAAAIGPAAATMAAPRRVMELAVGAEELSRLEAIARSRTEAACRVERARVLLAYRTVPLQRRSAAPDWCHPSRGATVFSPGGTAWGDGGA